MTQDDIYRLNPDSVAENAARKLTFLSRAYMNQFEDRKDSSFNWPEHYRVETEFFAELRAGTESVFRKIGAKTNPNEDIEEHVRLFMKGCDDIAEVLGMNMPTVGILSYDDMPPRAYLWYPHVAMPDSDFDQELFPELKTHDTYMATLTKGDSIAVDDFPTFVYMHCPQNYDGTAGFVPEDAIKLTEEQVEVYNEKVKNMVGDGFGEGPYQPYHVPIVGTDLPADFDLNKHQHAPRTILGSNALKNVSARWKACDIKDEERSIPLPPYPTEWAKENGFAL